MAAPAGRHASLSYACMPDAWYNLLREVEHPALAVSCTPLFAALCESGIHQCAHSIVGNAVCLVHQELFRLGWFTGPRAMSNATECSLKSGI